MAFTYSYQDALNAARPSYGRDIDASQLTFVLNNAIAKMWAAYDWRGTTSELEPFYLTGLNQDYGAPFYVVPTDFWGLRETYLVSPNTSVSPRTAINVTSNIEQVSLIGLPTAICYRPAIAGFRVWPLPPDGCGTDYFIDGTYKKRPPKITRADLALPLLWDDVYFNCFTQALIHAALVNGGRRDDAMKQEIIFRTVLAEDTSTENQELGEPVVHPQDSAQSWSRNNMSGFWYGGN